MLTGHPARPHAAVSAPPAQSADAKQQHAIAKVRDALETIEKKEEHLQRKCDNEVKQAKAFSAANKKREALACVKRKRMYDKQLEQLRCPALRPAASPPPPSSHPHAATTSRSRTPRPPRPLALAATSARRWRRSAWRWRA